MMPVRPTRVIMALGVSHPIITLDGNVSVLRDLLAVVVRQGVNSARQVNKAEISGYVMNFREVRQF